MRLIPDAEVGRDEAAAWLTVRHGERVFIYRLGARSRPRPVVSQRDAPVGRRLLDWRLTAQTGDGSRPYDVTGFTQNQIVADVLEKLQELGWRIGAENSGHVILLDKTTTGDGIVAGLQVLISDAKPGG